MAAWDSASWQNGRWCTLSNWREDLLSPAHLMDDVATVRQRQVALAPWLQQPQAIRTILFDAGFTLIHPNPSMAGIVERVCGHEGVRAPAAEVRAHLPAAEHMFYTGQHIARGTWGDNAAINAAWLDYFHALIAPFIPADQPALIARCEREVLAEFDRHTAWQIFEDVLPTLHALKGRYALGIISDWSIALGEILRDLHLSGFFDVLVVSATTRRAKPDPFLFDLALQRADAIGAYTLYIGDSYVQDILGARAVGIHPLLIDRRRRLDPMQIDCPIITQLTDLLALLDLGDDG